MTYNVALSGLGYRRIVRDAREQASYQLRMSGRDPIVAFDAPRAVTRAERQAPAGEIGRAVTLLVRQAEADG